MKNISHLLLLLVLTFLAAISVKLYAATPKTRQPQIWTPGCVASVPGHGAHSVAHRRSQAWRSKTAPEPYAF
jgi:hypothetical protein